MKKLLFPCLLLNFLSIPGISMAQSRTDTLLENLLLRDPDSILQLVIHHPGYYRVQIIYTQINRDRHDRPSFRNYYFHVDPRLYFNPASTVKMPLAFLALQKLDRLRIRGLSRNSPMQIDSSYPGQTREYRDSTSRDGYPSLAQYIRRAFLVSDNDAYNRLYEFLGQGTLNKDLHAMGYGDTRIIRQFLGFTQTQNRHTNQIRFLDRDGNLIYVQPPAYNRDSFDFSHRIFLGKAHYDNRDSLIQEPMDFTRQNNISLEDLQRISQSVLFPRSVPRRQRFRLRPGDYRFLYRYMSEYPSESSYPKYDSASYPDSYVKFYFKGEVIPPYIKVFNKVGWSYGFLTDISYLADFKNRVEYMLSCTLYVNSDQILNDDRYDYLSIGYPLLRELGTILYTYELKRKRTYSPDLSRFRIHYGKRDPMDRRPVVKDIAN